MLSDATFYDSINIYQFGKPFLDKKCLSLKNMEPLTQIHPLAQETVFKQADYL